MMDYSELINKHKRYFLTGKTLDVKYRKEQLKAFANALKKNERLLYDAIWSDFHKSEFETFATELGILYSGADYAKTNLTKWTKPKKVLTNLPNLPGSSYIMPEPYGTALVIGAWNYPYLLSLGPLIGAMAAGNTMILNPANLLQPVRPPWQKS